MTTQKSQHVSKKELRETRIFDKVLKIKTPSKDLSLTKKFDKLRRGYPSQVYVTDQKPNGYRGRWPEAA
jgi:hypothetical protein